jgi:hypothetical protein
MHYPNGGDIAALAKIVFLASSSAIFILTTPKSYGHWAAFIGLILFVAVNLNIEVIDTYSIYIWFVITICIVLYYWDVGMEYESFNLMESIDSTNKFEDFIKLACPVSLIIGLVLKLMGSYYASTFLVLGVGFAGILIVMWIYDLIRKD